MARLLMTALRHAGHTITLASSLRCWEGKGDRESQQALEQRAALETEDLRAHFRIHPRPDLWFTYHLYHKAPDMIGPEVCREFGIPYVAAEPSHAPKQATGRWAEWHRHVAGTLGNADAVFYLNPSDEACVQPLLKDGARGHHLPPFTDCSLYESTVAHRQKTRAEIASSGHLDPQKPWLLASAMMREDVKKQSYALLADALRLVQSKDWELIIVGDGPARSQVEDLFGFASNTAFLGALTADRLAHIQTACDLAVWPSLNEAFGLALLEAQAAGLPVVSGRNTGVANMIRSGETGTLVEMGDAGAFAAAIDSYLIEPDRRRRHGAAARQHVMERHSLPAASGILSQALERCVEAYRR